MAGKRSSVVKGAIFCFLMVMLIFVGTVWGLENSPAAVGIDYAITSQIRSSGLHGKRMRPRMLSVLMDISCLKAAFPLLLALEAFGALIYFTGRTKFVAENGSRGRPLTYSWCDYDCFMVYRR